MIKPKLASTMDALSVRVQGRLGPIGFIRHSERSYDRTPFGRRMGVNVVILLGVLLVGGGCRGGG